MSGVVCGGQSRDSPLTEDQARFYAGCVIAGLEYMQDRNIVWRCALLAIILLLTVPPAAFINLQAHENPTSAYRLLVAVTRMKTIRLCED